MFNRSKLGAVVVLYNPPANIRENISTYLSFVNYLCIIDNSDCDNSNFFSAATFSNVHYFPNNQNLGIAAALNKGIQFCEQLGCEWVLTMDQDSSFQPNEIAQYLKCIEESLIRYVGIFAPNYIHKLSKISSCDSMEVDTAITSGSIINIKKLSELGGFNEKLFIDGVDDDICYRFKLAGYKVLHFKNVTLTHQLGEPRIVRNWFIGKMVSRNLHSPIRIYYMVRNYLYLINRYKVHFPSKIPEYRKELLIKIKNGILYDNNRWLVIKLAIRGIIDFRLNKFGKLEKGEKA